MSFSSPVYVCLFGQAKSLSHDERNITVIVVITSKQIIAIPVMHYNAWVGG
jgi:hypothetical protein